MTDKKSPDSVCPKTVSVHPILLAAFPVAVFYASNLGYLDVRMVIRPLVVSMTAAVALMLLLERLVGDRVRAALVTSLVLLAFSSYGYAYDSVERFNGYVVDPSGFSSLEVLLHLLGAAALGGVGFFFLRCKNPHPWAYFMNLWALILIVFSMLHFARHHHETSSALEQLSLPKAEKLHTGSNAGARPDIYFIVLDGYGRADILEEYYNYDNSKWTEYLEQKGFFVAHDSNSNYSTTAISITSTLNLNYISKFVKSDLKKLKDWGLARKLIQENPVARLLENEGYTTVAFHSLFPNAEFRNADLLIEKKWFLNYFEMGLLTTTPIPWVFRKFNWPILEDLHRRMTLETLNELPSVAELPGPKFVYAHLLCPHPPFLFGPRGEPVEPERMYRWLDGKWYQGTGATKESYIEGYRDQVEFVNSRLKPVINAILARSESSPVIVLQGDHGPAAAPWIWDRQDPSIRERFGILNAIHLPGEGENELYDSISPVNTFRVIFNRYLATDYELLEDRCYFVADEQPYAPLPVFENQPPGTCPPWPDEEDVEVERADHARFR